MEKKTIRFPRPLGVTQLMKEYKTSKDTTILDKIQSYYIQWKHLWKTLFYHGIE